MRPIYPNLISCKRNNVFSKTWYARAYFCSIFTLHSKTEFYTMRARGQRSTAVGRHYLRTRERNCAKRWTFLESRDRQLGEEEVAWEPKVFWGPLAKEMILILTNDKLMMMTSLSIYSSAFTAHLWKSSLSSQQHPRRTQPLYPQLSP